VPAHVESIFFRKLAKEFEDDTPVPVKRPYFRYAFLAFLFVIAMMYQVRRTQGHLSWERINILPLGVQGGSNKIIAVGPSAIKAGLHTGDLLLAVNGVAYTGTGVLGDAQEHARPGVPVVLTVRSSTSPFEERTVSFPMFMSRSTFWEVATDLALRVVLPAECLLLGFWVALVRPRDGQAWLLLALMLTFPLIVGFPDVSGWGRGWREIGTLYSSALINSFPILMFWFGRDFPEPFAKGSRYDRVWSIQQWLLVLPFAVVAFPGIVISVGQLSDYSFAAPLARLIDRLGRIPDILAYLLIGSFFAAMGIKLRLSKSCDARRRLHFLYWGTTLAFGPALVITIWGLVMGSSAGQIFPQWFIVVVLCLLLLFPLTLAYVIVVQKAMAVSVALRQGMQYALAKTGLRALQALLVAGAITAAMSMAADPSRNRPQKITVIALGVTAVVIVRRMGGTLRTRIDRRFFREAYNAEQVLTELSEQVRSMVDLKPLLETVAARISETLHVPQIAVLLGASDAFQPAVALGYSDLSRVAFRRDAGMAKVLQTKKEPAQVFLNDRDSWLYREKEIHEEERDKLAELHSELLLPLSARDKLLGFISLGPKKSEEPYTGSDVRLLRSVAAQTGLALENAELMREVASQVAQRERLNREVEIAREVQERLFPQKLPAIADLDYAGYCRPALGVGGDYYDFLALPQGRLGVAIGDVSGKGIAAALMMASLQASLRGEATRGPENLALAVANVNRLVYEASSESRYATFFYGQYDPSTRKFDYVNAGHNPPMLFHRRQGQWTVTRLDVGGVVVGLLASFPYQQGSIDMAAGDLLVAYTDGISEAMNGTDEEWGEDRLIGAVEQCDGLPAEGILQRVFAAADAFVNGHAQHDDMTMVVLRVMG
jgi:sigma-B regulation protein RsbU (phosphoserine phosphatase)